MAFRAARKHRHCAMPAAACRSRPFSSLARSYALAVERRLAPEYLGLAAETNLIRLAAPAGVYQAVRQVANDTNTALIAAGATSVRYISVQVETAWGRLTGGTGPWLGVEQDFTDFPFTQALGLSSYPYLGHAQPEDLPADYYSRLRGTRSTPMLVTEGGWSSASVGNLNSSPALQARYIQRHADLLDSVDAVACCQLQFADIDVAALTPPVPAESGSVHCHRACRQPVRTEAGAVAMGCAVCQAAPRLTRRLQKLTRTKASGPL